MRYRSTLALLAVAIGLGLFVYLYEIRGREARDAAEQAGKRLLALEREAVTAVELPLKEEGRARLAREAGGEDDAPARWRLEAPFAFPADRDEVDRILDALEELESKGAFDAPADLDPFGLGEERAEVRVFAGGDPLVVWLGGDAPVGGQSYAAVGEAERVHTVERWRTTSLRPELKRLRDSRLVSIEDAAVTGLRVTAAGALVAALTRVESAESDAPEVADHDWRLVEPVADRADAERARRLLQDLELARGREFIDAPGEPVEYGLEAPALELTLEGEGRTESLAVGRKGDKVYARVAGRELVYEVYPTLLDNVPTDTFQYRHKAVLDVDPREVEGLELQFPREGVSYAFSLDDGDWEPADEGLEVRAFMARDLVEELAELEAVGIEETSFEPAALGLDPARVRVVLRSAGGETLATLALGDPESARVPASAPPSGRVWQLDAEISDHVPFGHEAFRNRWVEPEPPAAPEPEPPAAPEPEEAPGDDLPEPEL